LLRPSNIQCRAAADGPRWRQPDVGLWSLHRGL